MRTTLTLAAFVPGLFVGGLALAQAPTSGTYLGRLNCEASQLIQSEGPFSDPVTVEVQGSKLTWTRKTSAVSEVIEAALEGDRALLDGYGGAAQIDPSRRPATWDWKLKGQLAYAGGTFSGDVDLLGKDGRTLERHCKFVSSAGAGAVASAANTPVAAAPIPAPAAASTPLPAASTADAAADLRRREEALAARERVMAEREQRLAQAAQPAAAPAPAQAVPATVAPTGPSSAPAQPAEANPGPGDSATRAAMVLGSVAAEALARKQGSPWPLGAGGSARDAVQTAMAMQSGPLRGGATPWPNKAAFLAAAREGQFVALARLTDASPDGNALVNTVANVLGTDYGIPQLPRQAQGCGLQYRLNVIQYFKAITEREVSSLSDRPPSYRQPGRNEGPTPEDVARSIQSSPNCDLEAVGMRQAHPYKQALIQLGADYAQATRAYVEGEAQRREAAYAREQAQRAEEARRQREQAQRQRELVERQDAALRAAEQRRIDAERARIEAEEKRRQEIQRSRVGG